MSRRRPSPFVAALLVTLLGVLLRLPFVGTPLSSDEAGFLRIAAQWAPGRSLYGDYWVDRPPLIIGLFQVANLLGGAVGLRVVGIVALVISCAFAAGIGRLVTDWRWAPPVLAAVTTLLLSDPLFGALEVDGELLAVPFVLAGLFTLLRALGRPAGSQERRLLWVATGVLAVLAPSVKQSMVDVFVGAAIALLWLLWQRRWRLAVGEGLLFALGAAVAGFAVVGWAALNGTRPGPLFEAVVTFRGQASQVISEQASSATTARAHHLLEAFVTSGAWVLGLLAALSAVLWWRRRTRLTAPDPALPLAWVALGVALWETAGVVAGGSYWLHYLIGTVPGTVLLVAATLRAQQVRARWVVAVLCYVLAAAVPALVVSHQTAEDDSDVQVAHYLQAHAAPGESAVVAFGHVNVLEGTGLSDPYVHLWSLPVRVRDPHLVLFTRTLRHDRPTWLVVAGPKIDTWAIDATRANAVIARDYRPVTHIGEWYLFRARNAR